jgi:hypothetical protein
MNYSKFHLIALAALALIGSNRAAHAGPDDKPAPTVAPPPPVSPLPMVDVLVDVDFDSEYLTPRGMIVHNDGATIEPIVLGFIKVYQGTGWLNSVKLDGGVWNDFSTTGVAKNAPFGSNPKTNFVETDPIAGFSLGLFKYFTFDATYTAFVDQILSIGTSHHFYATLSFDDSKLLNMNGFGIHPYVTFWQELGGKATDADVPAAVLPVNPQSGHNPNPGSSFYFDIGIDPTYTFTGLYGLKLEAPLRVLLPDSRFYGEYYGKASTVGLFELGARASVPLKFMPANLGHWETHVGYRYQNYVDDNLFHLNTFNAPGHPVRVNNQVYSGISVFF